MSINFPDSPQINEVYNYGIFSWIWTGVAWEIYTESLVTSAIFNSTLVTHDYYEASISDMYIGVDYPGQVTIVLPSGPSDGQVLVIKDESGEAGEGANRTITITGASDPYDPYSIFDSIDNQDSAIININNGSISVIYFLGQWRII